MGIKFSNNASANIIQALTSTATSVSVIKGKGDLFPSLTEGDYFYATLVGNNGLEIVKVTNRVKDTMTIVRAQDNTTALSFDTGDLFELRIVAADFNDTFSEVNDKLEASISEVNNKLEASLEETTSIVNSALSSKAPILHASSSTEYGAGSSDQYGHLKSHDLPDSTKTADMGHAFSPAGAAAMQDVLEGQIGDLAGVVSGNATTQAARDAEQNAAITAAQTAADNAQTAAGNALAAAGNALAAASAANEGLIGVVRIVNDVEADDEGKVEVPIPVVSVNGMTGAVTVSSVTTSAVISNVTSALKLNATSSSTSKQGNCTVATTKRTEDGTTYYSMTATLPSGGTWQWFVVSNAMSSFKHGRSSGGLTVTVGDAGFFFAIRCA